LPGYGRVAAPVSIDQDRSLSNIFAEWLEVWAFILAFELFSGPVTSLKQFGAELFLVFGKFLIAQIPVLPQL